MNDDIKEILSLLNSSSWSNEAKQIEDYITNLQQENERINHQLEVQKELTERNRLRKHYYKSRIEKTVEYLKKETKDMPVNGCRIRLNEILDILNGRSE